jgi:tetratricopeptide (TPR) repeat protein
MDVAKLGTPDSVKTVDAELESAPDDATVLEAKVLVALGELSEAERLVARRLEYVAEDLTALNLFAKIKHLNGELSQAVACWARLHTSSPHNERALMRLASLFELAQDPERHAGEFVALAPPHLAGLIELEAAFRQLIARRPEEARATCSVLAVKHRGNNRELYKLCVLAKAWISELSGDFAGACRTLEDLGGERGFETDTDRVLGLARVYERLGDPQHLEKAVHVHRWLDRSFEKISAQSRLAGLHRKLGNHREAERYERRFQRAFERRMHRPSRAEVARIAASRFLPLERLAAVKVSSDQSSELLDAGVPRQQAIFDFLSGDQDRARAQFAETGELLDRKYLGSLQALTGDFDGSLDVMLAALEEDPHDARLACHVLLGRPAKNDDATSSRNGPELVARYKSGLLGELVREGLAIALTHEPRRASLWRALGKLLEAQGKRSEAAIHHQRAKALDDARERDAEAIGRVLAAAVYRFVGKSKGLVHQVWADRKPASPGRGGFLHSEDVLGNLTPDMRQAVRNTFLAVREYARSRFPHRTSDILDYDYTYKVTKEDEPSGGLSAGVPTALAFLSVFLQQPIPQDIAFSGVLISDSHDVLVVRGVGDAEYKLKAAYHRNLRAIVLPAENREELERSREVPRAATEELARFVANIDQAITITFGDRIWID